MHRGFLSLLIIALLLIAICIITLINEGNTQELYTRTNEKLTSGGMLSYEIGDKKIGGVVKTDGQTTTTQYYIWIKGVSMWKAIGIEVFDHEKKRLIEDTFKLNNNRSGLSTL